MTSNKAVRSMLAVLALTGMAACSSNNSGDAPQAPVVKTQDGVSVLSETVQISAVEAKFADTAVAESSDLFARLNSIKSAEVRRETGSETRMVIDMKDASGASALVFQTREDFTEAASATEGVAAAATVEHEGTVVRSLSARVGENLDVIFTFGPDQKQGQDQDQKQDEPKQDEPKQDEPKQDEPKQDEPKQDEPKQDEPKQDEPKQDEPKQDEPKQDEPKQDEPKQDEPKQDEPKQDEPKQDEPKQDQKM